MAIISHQDETLFTAVLHNDNHILRYNHTPGLPQQYSYCLIRPKRHQLTLALGAILVIFSKDFCLKTHFVYVFHLFSSAVCCVLSTIGPHVHNKPVR